MIARKKTSISGKNLPKEWEESLSRLLNETYQAECKKFDRYFDVYGQIFQEELLLVVSFLAEKDEYLAPVTLFLSCDADQMSNEKKVKETQKDFIELAGLFFDEVLAQEDWNEFEPQWQEVKHNHQTYFFKLSRENVNLTLEANRLLGEEFPDIEQEEDQEEQEH